MDKLTARAYIVAAKSRIEDAIGELILVEMDVVCMANMPNHFMVANVKQMLHESVNTIESRFAIGPDEYSKP